MKLVLGLLFFLLCNRVDGQVVFPVELQLDTLIYTNEPFMVIRYAAPEPFMLSRLDFTDDFRKRFNYETTPAGKKMDDALRRQISRKMCLESLFDQTDARLNKRMNFDQRYYQAKEILVDQILENDLYLPGMDSSLFASLNFTAAYMGKEVSGTMYLKKVKAPYSFRWKIIDASVPFLHTQTDPEYIHSVMADSSSKYIRSNAHETNFLSLYSLLGSGTPLLKLTEESSIGNAALIALSKSIQNKQCVLDQFSASIFVPVTDNWVVKIENFTRESENSGWLISDLYSELSGSQLPDLLRSYFPGLYPPLTPSSK